VTCEKGYLWWKKIVKEKRSKVDEEIDFVYWTFTN
jgi:hypothetical protein